MIRAVSRIARHGPDAEDAFQNALTAIWKNRHRLASHASPHALILKICIDSAYDVVRKRGRNQQLAEPDSVTDQLVDTAPLPLEELARRETSDEIIAAMNRLSRSQAVAMTLRAFENLPYERIAAAMNCTAATARKHVERARAHLRVVLAKYEPLGVPRS